MACNEQNVLTVESEREMPTVYSFVAPLCFAPDATLSIETVNTCENDAGLVSLFRFTLSNGDEYGVAPEFPQGLPFETRRDFPVVSGSMMTVDGLSFDLTACEMLPDNGNHPHPYRVKPVSPVDLGPPPVDAADDESVTVSPTA